MVVPEAFLVNGEDSDKVYVVTSQSSSCPYEEIEKFFADRPETQLLFHRVKGFEQLKKDEEHLNFAEALMRIYLQARADAHDGRLDICLTGGYKTMSASLQRAARLLGADSLFHVLCDDNPDNAESVGKSYQLGHIRKISLGNEPGHRLLDSLSPQQYPIGAQHKSENEYLVPLPSPPLLSQEIEKREAILRRRGDADSIHHKLPFRCLGFLSDEWIDWLGQPLDPEIDESWIRSLPKVELHSHLGGFATRGEKLAHIRSRANHPQHLPKLEEPPLPLEWPFPRQTVTLTDYMALGDATGSTLLKDPGCLRAHIQLLLRELSQDQVHYCEIRCSPVNYSNERIDREPLEVVEDIRSAVKDAQVELHSQGKLVPQIALIIIVNRSREGDLSRVSEHIALATTLVRQKPEEIAPVVGIDLAGFENPETRPEYFRQDFEPVHRKGLAVTVHAGENDDPESIWQAVYQLSARRIGHGLNLLDAPHLLRAVADRGIGIELCPYANCQIKGFAPMQKHEKQNYPLLPYLARGVLATVNVDNLGISGANHSDNLLLLPKISQGITRLEVLQLLRNAVDLCFLPVAEKPRLRQRIEQSLAKLFVKEGL